MLGLDPVHADLGLDRSRSGVPGFHIEHALDAGIGVDIKVENTTRAQILPDRGRGIPPGPMWLTEPKCDVFRGKADETRPMMGENRYRHPGSGGNCRMGEGGRGGAWNAPSGARRRLGWGRGTTAQSGHQRRNDCQMRNTPTVAHCDGEHPPKPRLPSATSQASGWKPDMLSFSSGRPTSRSRRSFQTSSSPRHASCHGPGRRPAPQLRRRWTYARSGH